MPTLTLRQLTDLEEIRQLKARYARLLDTRDWAHLREVFTADCVLERHDPDGTPAPVAEAIVSFLRALLNGQRTAHRCIGPEIELLGPDTARATWATMVIRDGGASVSHGYYRDAYAGPAARWRISRYRFDPAWP